MANITLLSRLLNGVQREVNLGFGSGNVLELASMQLDGSTSGHLIQNANATTTSYTVYWPSAQGGALTFLQNDGSGNLSWASAGSGSVTSVSVVSANGFAGTVATATTTPAITIETTITASILAGNGTAISAAALSQNDIYVGNASNLPVAVAMSGDATIVSSGALTLATVNSNVGSFGSSTSIPTFTVNAKGLITAASGNAVVAPAGTLSGTTLNSTVVSSSLTSLGTQAQALNMGSFQINNVANPSSAQDAATKNYVDNLVQGLNWKETVRTATTGALPSYTYNNGTSGVGATLTSTTNGPLPAQDGVTLVLNDRILVKNESGGNLPYNGIYYVSQVGVLAVSPWILTRSLDADTAPTLQWATVEVSPDASTQAGQIWREADDITTIGTDSVAFLLVSSGINYSFGNGLQVIGSTVSVLAEDNSINVAAGGISVVEDPAGAIVTGASGILVQLGATNPGLAITSNHLDVKYNPAGAIVASSSGIAAQTDGSSLDINGSNQLEIKAAGVTLAKLASNSVDENKIVSTAFSASGAITGGSGTKIAVAVDNSSIEISSDALRIKTTAYDQKTITGGGGSAAAVAYAPAVEFAGVAGQAFSANTTYALRYGIVANGETASRLYAADYAPGSPTTDQFWVVGFLAAGSSVSAADPITVMRFGSLTLGSGDGSLFVSNDNGTPIFLQGSGSFKPVSTATLNTSGNANAKLGIVTSTTTFLVDIGAPYVY